MEKFFLCAFLAADELNIVYEQHVGFTVSFAEFSRALVADGCDNIIGKFVALYINNVIIWAVFADFSTDGV